jgi:hypothetical protein
MSAFGVVYGWNKIGDANFLSLVKNCSENLL